MTSKSLLSLNPTICVSVPCYKSKETIKKTVKSILNQSYSNLILYVIDDNDPHNSTSVLDNIIDKRLIIIKLPYNIGRYAIDHLIVNSINYDYWVPHDSDDYSDKDWLYEMVKSSSLSTDVTFTDQFVYCLKTKRKTLQCVKNWDRTNSLNWHAHMSGLWKVDFIRKNNLTNPNLRVAWDTLMTSIPFLIGNVNIINKPLYHRIKRHNSLTNNISTGMKSKYRKNITIYLKELWSNIVDLYYIDSNEIKNYLKYELENNEYVFN